MKFIHLSDLHIGKRILEFSMLEDQKYILMKILKIIDEEKPDGVLIAGDVYDKSIPSTEAVELFDDFLYRLSKMCVQVFVISGNHDSPERVAFGSRLMDSSGIHISPVYNGKVMPVSMTDEYGIVDVYMLPFVKPVHVRRFFEDEKIESYTDAVKVAVSHMKLNKKNRNILVTHQFVTGAIRCDSEEITVGGTDNVDVSALEEFDYVALGHIHNPQNIGKKTVRYCGTPLKYSFSEVNHEKSITVVEMDQKGKCLIRTIPLVSEHNLREIKGIYYDITQKKNYEGTDINDYLHITLTDEEDIPDAVGKLRVIYPNLMKLDYDNKRTRTNAEINIAEEVLKKSPLEIFSEFYEKQNNQSVSDEQKALIKDMIEKIWEDNI